MIALDPRKRKRLIAKPAIADVRRTMSVVVPVTIPELIAY
ncbi:unannotated protein [freshwater metagenome]|uniref:Unannotated protein n=1 Tax=freshwater metagenome TaxID=449393 RepID=A0A6J6L603_9ZZZZ